MTPILRGSWRSRAQAKELVYWPERCKDVQVVKRLRDAGCPPFAERVDGHLQGMNPPGVAWCSARAASPMAVRMPADLGAPSMGGCRGEGHLYVAMRHFGDQVGHGWSRWLFGTVAKGEEAKDRTRRLGGGADRLLGDGGVG